MLDAHGYEMVQIQEGMKALELARNEQPDLILMDIQLPEVSDIEVMTAIREKIS